MAQTDGLCQCGCGEPAPLARSNDRLRGYVKGEPLRFIYGHYRRPSGGSESRDCAYCGQPFTPQQKNQRHCATLCWNRDRKRSDDDEALARRAERAARECVVCAAPVGPTRWRYCSERCAKRAWHLIPQGRIPDGPRLTGRRRRWTREIILARMRRWFENTGNLPRACDWQKTGGEWPSVFVVCREFGSFRAAVAVAEEILVARAKRR